MGPSPLREAATFPPQADHVLVVLFFIRGGPGGCVKAPRQIPTVIDPGGMIRHPETSARIKLNNHK